MKTGFLKRLTALILVGTLSAGFCVSAWASETESGTGMAAGMVATAAETMAASAAAETVSTATAVETVSAVAAAETATMSADEEAAGDEVTVDEDDRPYIALGADLSSDERATVLSLLGVTEEDLENYDVVTVTNDQEHEYLDSYISSSTIGTRALSSVVVMEAEDGTGITVTTKNISYCTAGMYENALATAGVEDAEVIVAGPFSISGTAALIGALEAYSVMTGEDIDEDVVDGAINEIVITGAIEESTGTTDEVEGMVAYLKDQVGGEDDLTDEEMEEAIQDAADEFGVTLTDEEIQQLKELLRKLQGLDLDWDTLASQAQSVYDRLTNMGFDLSSIDTDELAEEASGFFAKIAAFFKSLFSRLAG
ncbi:MAG: DUF1002 domain-containing protein [Lachnospiraceae bacterium]|nr:DUF1002 domain-containing protein [Lachnospiraceae bacterium]